MKLKNYWKRFWTLDRHHAEGFTLVELIVVIAILAILTGVGIPVYSGYITKANKGVDQTMVSDLVRSIELAAILDPDAFPSDATLYLSTGAAKTTGTDAAKLDSILADAYGSNFKNSLKLKYAQWGLGETITTHAKKLNTALNGATLSYTENVDELWTVVDEILVGLESTATMDSVYGGSAGLMSSAADYTLNGIEYASGTDKQVEFAKMWANPSDSFSAYGAGEYDSSSTNKDTDTLDPMLARYAAIKARNYTFANWLSSKSGMSGIAGNIMNCSTGTIANGGVAIPRNFMEVIGINGEIIAFTDVAVLEQLAGYINEYFGVPCVSVVQSPSLSLVVTPVAAGTTASQAYTDALGYYTLMNAVNDSSSDTKGMSNDEYRQTMADAVHNVGALLNTPDLIDEVSGGCVAITVKKAQDGTISYYITPASIYAGGNDTVQSGVGQSTTQTCAETTILVDFNNGLTFSKSNDLVLLSNSTGTITLVAGDGLKSMAESSGQDINTILGGILAGFTSKDSTVVNISNGNVTAGGVGNTTITFEEDGNVFVSINVTVSKK